MWLSGVLPRQLGIDVRLLFAYPTARKLAAAVRQGAAVGSVDMGSAVWVSAGGGGALDAAVRVDSVTEARPGGTDGRGEPRSGEGKAAAGAPPVKRRRVDGGAGAAAAVPAAATAVALWAPLVAGGSGEAAQGAAATGGPHRYLQGSQQHWQPHADQPVAAQAAGGRQREGGVGEEVEGGERSPLPSLHCAVEGWRWVRWRTGGGAGGQGGQAHTLYRHGHGQLRNAGQQESLADTVGVNQGVASLSDGCGDSGGTAAVQGEEGGGRPAAEGTCGQGPGQDGGHLQGVWRYQLGRCVDAPVVFAELAYDSETGAEAAPGTPMHGWGQQQQGPSSDASPGHPSSSVVHCVLPLVLACSHDGDVACLDAHSGRPHWHVRLPARAEAGLALAAGPATSDHRGTARQCTASAGPYRLPYVVVACDDGQLYSLDLRDGHVRGVVPCGGAFKCAPAADPWVGAVWATSHGRCVTVVRPPDQVLTRCVSCAGMHWGRAPERDAKLNSGQCHNKGAHGWSADGVFRTGFSYREVRMHCSELPGHFIYVHIPLTASQRRILLPRLPRYHVGAPMSTPVVFCTLPPRPGAYTPAPPDAPGVAPSHTAIGSPPTHGSEQRLAVVTALDGSTHVLQVDLGPAARAGTAATACGPNNREEPAVTVDDAAATGIVPNAPGGDGVLYEEAAAYEVAGVSCLWVARGPAPVFSAPVVVAWGAGGSDSHSSPSAPGSVQARACYGPAQDVLLAVGHVDGTVRAFPLCGCGAGAGTGAVNGAVGQGRGGGSGGGGSCGGTGSGDGRPAGAEGQGGDQLPAPALVWTAKLRGNLFADLLALCTTQLAGHPAATRASGCGAGAALQAAPWGRGLVIAATHAGVVYGLDPWSGATIWALELRCGAISAAPAVLPTQWRGAGQGSRGRMPAAALMLVCSGAGEVFLVGLPAGARGAGALQRNQEEGAAMARGDNGPWVMCTARLPGTCLTSEHLPYTSC